MKVLDIILYYTTCIGVATGSGAMIVATLRILYPDPRMNHWYISVGVTIFYGAIYFKLTERK